MCLRFALKGWMIVKVYVLYLVSLSVSLVYASDLESYSMRSCLPLICTMLDDYFFTVSFKMWFVFFYVISIYGLRPSFVILILTFLRSSLKTRFQDVVCFRDYVIFIYGSLIRHSDRKSYVFTFVFYKMWFFSWLRNFYL